MQTKSAFREHPTFGTGLTPTLKESLMKRVADLGIILSALPFALVIDLAKAQTAGTPSVTPRAASQLTPEDSNFVAQANLGAAFQVDSGRIADEKGGTSAIRDYAHLMVTSHIPVVDALNKSLQRKGLTAPPNTLLQGAYHAMIASLKADNRAALDRDYVEDQVEYQKGNAALFENEIRDGTDPDLKEFARATLPKIEDHLQWALKLAKSAKLATDAPQ
jgi:putative membrane protein